MTNTNSYENFYDEAARNAKRGLNRQLTEIASVEQDTADDGNINITVILDEDSSKNLNADELRLLKSIFDNAARKYGYQANFINVSGSV